MRYKIISKRAGVFEYCMAITGISLNVWFLLFSGLYNLFCVMPYCYRLKWNGKSWSWSQISKPLIKNKSFILISWLLRVAAFFFQEWKAANKSSSDMLRKFYFEVKQPETSNKIQYNTSWSWLLSQKSSLRWKLLYLQFIMS